MKRKKRSISDKERLDWIQSGWFKGASFFVAPSGAVFRGGGRGAPYRGRADGYNKSLRLAIDAAIRAERASRKESKNG